MHITEKAAGYLIGTNRVIALAARSSPISNVEGRCL